MEIHFEIENKCLLGCRHCSSYASSCGHKMDYSVGDISLFLNKLKGRKEVYLTGGEPLLYPEIDMLLKKLHMEVDDIVLGMFTTGIRGNDEKVEAISEQYARQLAQNGLRVCYLSVYSCIKEEHDWMTNLESSFDLTRISISNLRRAGIEVRFNSVVTSKNQNQIPELIELAKDWDVTEVRLLKLINHGRAKKCWNTIGITEEQYRDIVKAILHRDNPVRVTASGVVDIIPCRLFYGKNICPAGKELWYVTYHGDVYPCASVKNQSYYKIGNIKEDVEKKREEFCELSNGKLLCKCSML